MEGMTMKGESQVLFKTSQFNEYLGRGEEGWLIYNNLSAAMIEVPYYVYKMLRKDKNLSFKSINIISNLEKGHFIVPIKEDEIETLRKKRDRIYESVEIIALQILPTLKCNFRCIYCYENLQNDNKFMTKKVMDAIVEYLKKTIKPTTRYLYISWYGGEPLLGIKQIKYLSNFFLNICDENNIQYFPHITTNGYLLNKQNVDLLVQLRIKSLQVTIDGPENIHNIRRMLKNGGGTYEKILKNLQYAISQNMDIAIRVNIDKTNEKRIEDLLIDLKGRGILRNNVRISFGVVGNFGNACKDLEESLITSKELMNIIKNRSKLRSFLAGINPPHRPLPHLIGCSAPTKTSLIIGPEGELYKCSKTIGNKEEICGTIFNIDYNHPNFKKWISEDRLSIQQCQRCSMIPICDGNGCPYNFLIEKREKNKCNQGEKHRNYLKSLKTLYKYRKFDIKGHSP